MAPGPTHIGISLGNIQSLQDGLGEFALQMGQHIAARARPWQQQHGIRFTFHTRDQLAGVFGNDVDYVPVTRWQRLAHREPRHYAVWHSLHQLNKTLPPQGSGVRLLTVHDLNYLYGRSAFSTWRHQRRTLVLAQRTDHIVAISQYAADDVRKHLRWQGPLDVIYRGPRAHLDGAPAPLPDFEAVRRVDENGRPRPFLFHLSRMSPSKNPQAMLRLAAAWPQMDFLFCGPPTHDIRQLMAGPLPPNAHFSLGISDAQKAWAFAHCAGFLFPSFTEGFGLPPVEAMQYGKPVFLSRLTSLPEIGGDAAYYFDDWDPSAMRAVVEAGLAEGAHASRIADVKQHAHRFDWVAACDAYLALYLRLLGRNGQVARSGAADAASKGSAAAAGPTHRNRNRNGNRNGNGNGNG